MRATVGPRPFAAISLVFSLLLGGCSDLPDVHLGSCGNHVVEPSLGEQCDTTASSCGQSGGANACHWVCDPAAGISCPDGFSCGASKRCGQAAGTYTLSDPLPIAGSQFDIGDLDGDGFSDIVSRAGTQLGLYHNDGSGQFSVLAAGDGPAKGRDFQRAEVALSPVGTPRLVAPFGTSGVGLFGWAAGVLQPWALPSVVLPTPTTQRDLAFVVARPPDDAPVAVFLSNDDSGNQQLVAFPISAGTLAPGAPVSTIAVPDSCRATLPDVDVHHGLSGVTFIVGDFQTCVGGFDATGQLTLSAPLPWPDAAISIFTPASTPARFADIDGDGRVDIIDHVERIDSKERPSEWLVWLQATDGSYLPAQFIPPGDHDVVSRDVAIADFDGDGRDDLVANGALYSNRTQGQGATFDPSAGFVAQPAIAGSPPVATQLPAAAGDLNGDGHADYVAWFNGLTACFNAGDGIHFSCAPIAGDVDFSSRVLVSDVTGDGIDDLVVLSGGFGAGQSSVRVWQGRAAQTPATAPSSTIVVPGLGPTEAAVAVLPSKQAPLLAIATMLAWGPNGGYRTAGALAVGQLDANGLAQFVYGGDIRDAALADFDGDGLLDLAQVVAAADGYHVQLLPSLLPFGVVDAPLMVPTTELPPRFATLDPTRPPYLVIQSPMRAQIGSFANGVFTTQMLAQSSLDLTNPLEPPVVLTADVDRDGRQDLFYDALGTGVRVVKMVAGAPKAIDSVFSENYYFGDYLMALPNAKPLGLLGFTTSEMEGFTGQVPFYQLQPGSFSAEPESGFMLAVFDRQHQAVNPGTWYEQAVADFNGDGLDDMLVIGRDNETHIVFTDSR